MRTSASSSFNPKLSASCKRLFRLLKSPYKTHTSIRALRFRNLRRVATMKDRRRRRKKIPSLASVFKSSMKLDEIGHLIGEPKSVVESLRDPVPVPTPLTPSACVSLSRITEGVMEGEDAEEACRSFENYLVEMVVDEGKVKDLMDVEELIRCWDDLKTPAFVELVCRFYVEMCKDLFSGDDPEDDDDLVDQVQDNN